MKNLNKILIRSFFGSLAVSLVLTAPVFSEAPVDSSTDDAGISMPIASGTDSSVNLFDQTCYRYPCLNPGLSAADAAAQPSPFDSLGVDTSIGSVANYPTMGSHVFFTTKDGKVVTVDGYPLGANEIGKEPRYSVLEGDDGSILSVCDSVKQLCFIPSRLEVKDPSEVSIVHRTYEDVMQEREDRKKAAKENAQNSAETSSQDDQELDSGKKDGKQVDKDLSQEDPETREPGDWDECRTAGLQGGKAPTNNRSCINAYNNGMKSSGKKDFIPIDCSQGFVGPSLPDTLAKCPGKFDADMSAGMRGLEQELAAAGDGSDTEAEADDSTPTPNPHVDEDVEDPGDSPVQDEDVPEEEQTAVPFEMVNEMGAEELEGPGEQILPDVTDQSTPEEDESPVVNVANEVVLNSEDELEDREMEDTDEPSDDEPRFFNSDIVDEDGDLTEIPPDEPVDSEGEEMLQDLLGDEGDELDRQAQGEEDREQPAPPPAAIELDEEPGPDTIENPAANEEIDGQLDVFELQTSIEDAEQNLLTRDEESGVVQFVTNQEGQEVIGSIIKTKETPDPSVPGGSKSLSPEDLKKEFDLSDEQFDKELEQCRKATDNFKEKSFEDCLKENLERFADFLIRVE